ncbi:uncharacterized protein BCR38DRAFT_422674 [Pseudomassariella vexata]|uniref:Chitin-binding type-1 domain-containing protein n=1 Tax=Pseudomassariella vexata TaxID=1141098 RepID=A0A1Y2EAF8_9PEZI|nr:uncharacterized protein BCR38DRAFT_422674 [Pseudomassariella vexata]ORY68294.1 hypothetical protein BCR38DRAFT_422674 [Pseudomassariella vexata]
MSITNWEPASISAACSQVAKGTITSTKTRTDTVLVTAVETSTASSTMTVTATSTITVMESRPLSTDGRCGYEFRGQTCGGVCCSVWGWCGGGEDWCSWGCRSQFGTCW